MKKCAAGLAALFLIVIFLSPRAFAAGYELPEGTSITAQSAYFVNLDTGIVVFEQNADEQRSVASLTKLMTALLLMENVSDLENTKITAERSLYVPPITNPDSSTADIWPGETVSALNMLYAMMLPSANEAAEAVGYYLGNGNLNNFYALMNARAEEIGAHNTNFVTPNGLHDPEHYTTAYDLALIAAEAMKNPDFRKIVGSTYHKTTTGSVIRYMKNKNKILWQYEGGCGVKTGFTKAAGRCLVFAAERDGMTLIGAVLSCPDMFNVAKAMLDYGFASFRTEKIISAGQSITRIRVSGGTKTALAAEAKDDIIISVRIGESADIRTEVETRSGMNAPVEKGEDVGSVRVLMDGKLVGETRLLAAEDSLSLKFGQYLRKLLSGWAA